MYFTKAILLALIPVAAVTALPAPAPTPAPEPGLGDFFGSLVDKATSKVASFGDAVKAEATAKILYKDATKVLGTETSQVYATIVTVNGVPLAQVTSVNGPAVTLATDTKSGFTTSFGGHVFTVAPSSTAPSSSSSTSSSASATHTGKHNGAIGSFAVSNGVLMGAAGVVGSVLAGALVVL